MCLSRSSSSALLLAGSIQAAAVSTTSSSTLPKPWWVAGVKLTRPSAWPAVSRWQMTSCHLETVALKDYIDTLGWPELQRACSQITCVVCWFSPVSLVVKTSPETTGVCCSFKSICWFSTLPGGVLRIGAVGINDTLGYLGLTVQILNL